MYPMHEARAGASALFTVSCIVSLPSSRRFRSFSSKNSDNYMRAKVSSKNVCAFPCDWKPAIFCSFSFPLVTASPVRLRRGGGPGGMVRGLLAVYLIELLALHTSRCGMCLFTSVDKKTWWLAWLYFGKFWLSFTYTCTYVVLSGARGFYC